MRVLLCHPSVTVRSRVREALAELATEIRTVAGHDELAAEVERSMPDLVVSDLDRQRRMPDLVARWRADGDLRHLPVLLLDGGGDAGGLADFDGVRVLDAPYDAQVVVARVRELLRGRARPDAPTATARILAVDDSPTYLMWLRGLFAGAYRCDTAPSAEAALEVLRRDQRYDALLLDRQLPGIGGEELCRRLRADDATRALPIIMLTGDEDEATVVACLEAGADDFVAKNAGGSVLRARLQAQLRRAAQERAQRQMVEELARKELEVAEARAAQRLAETRAALTAELEERNRALQDMNAELEQYASIASHDLQEPLRTMVMNLDLLETSCPALDERSVRYLTHAVQAAERMRELVDSLLSFTRIDSVTSSFGEPVEADEALDEALANLERTIVERGARVERSPLPRVRAHRTLLVQLFQNLIGNGIKFCRRRPEIAIAAECGEGRCVFSIRDNGIGIDPAHHQRIFDAFQRLHARESFPGTGMGLAACRKIVERHGGRIWVDSVPGEGTTFFFTLAQS